MARWELINRETDSRTGSAVGATWAMKVPGGVLIRTATGTGEAGVSTVFVPMKETMIAPGVSSIDQWIADNKIIST